MKNKIILLMTTISIISASDFEYIKFKDIEIKNIDKSRFINIKEDLVKKNMDQCYIEEMSILCLRGADTYAAKLDGFKKETSLFLNSPIIKLKKLEIKGF